MGDIALDLAVEGVGSPVISEEGDTDDLSETVHLHATTADGIHDAGIMDHFYRDA